VTSASIWRCRTCRAEMGTVRGGALYPSARVESIAPNGLARIRCPGCAEIRAWRPASAGSGAEPAEPSR
jgi:hypothetical protein